MSLIRKRNGSNNQKIGVKKVASVADQDSNKISLDTGRKNTRVSGIVDQLIEKGYSGNLVSNAGMSYVHPNNSDPNFVSGAPLGDMTEDMVVDDINFENNSNEDEDENKTKPKKQKNQSIQSSVSQYEDRARNSQEQIKMVAQNAKAMYGNIDSFIGILRMAAENAEDNPRLVQKLENLRRMCVSFVRSVDQQMPNYATSLFVNNTEERENV